jgi:hypothetical protein
MIISIKVSKKATAATTHLNIKGIKEDYSTDTPWAPPSNRYTDWDPQHTEGRTRQENRRPMTREDVIGLHGQDNNSKSGSRPKSAPVAGRKGGERLSDSLSTY